MEWNNSNSSNYQQIKKLVYNLAVCHTIIVEKKDDQISYNASSPDELALINAARHFGVTFMERDGDNNAVIFDRNLNQNVKFEVLNIIEFTSTRKRMSIIVRTEDDKIICMCKGADSIIIPRLKEG